MKIYSGRYLMLLVVKTFLPLLCYAQTIPTEVLKMNQIGYYPNAPKTITATDKIIGDSFQVLEVNSRKVVYSGKFSNTMQWPLSAEVVKIGDFSSLVTSGDYILHVPKNGYSEPFKIAPNVLRDVFFGSVKGLYFQRAGMPLEEKYAGVWAREMGHLDDEVAFHESSGRSSGNLNSSKGWYDAGDYNKYIVNACFPLGQYFLFQEQYPNSIADGALNIPESGNGNSDYLDELRYELDWVLTMQDSDGGLFHKLTTKKFEGMVMPAAANSKRYVVGKGTAATLNFAAALAQAFRIFQKTEPDFAENCLQASEKAYIWALKNPQTEFWNPSDIGTGEYGDDNFEDERFWANAELYLSTSKRKYLNALKIDSFDYAFKAGESWTAYMRFLGLFSLMNHKKSVPDATYEMMFTGLINSADELMSKIEELPYGQPIDDFVWGSNSDVLNAAILIAQAYRLRSDKKYLAAVQRAADYILGNNALGYSFVTGFGIKTPMFIHHRQSEADTIAAPVPGLLSGGPNSRMQDKNNGAVYPENCAPMKAWVDQGPSFASNEICLNWNAPLTYILGFLENESN